MRPPRWLTIVTSLPGVKNILSIFDADLRRSGSRPRVRSVSRTKSCLVPRSLGLQRRHTLPRSTPSNLKRNCDDRMRSYIRARGQCQRCGNVQGPFECAHIIRRRYSWTRTDERNAWCLCHDCHGLVDTYVSEFNVLVGATIGWELFRELEERSMRREKFDWNRELDRWKALV